MVLFFNPFTASSASCAGMRCWWCPMGIFRAWSADVAITDGVDFGQEIIEVLFIILIHAHLSRGETPSRFPILTLPHQNENSGRLIQTGFLPSAARKLWFASMHSIARMRPITPHSISPCHKITAQPHCVQCYGWFALVTVRFFHNVRLLHTCSLDT